MLDDITHLDAPMSLREAAKIAFIDHEIQHRKFLISTALRELHAVIGNYDATVEKVDMYRSPEMVHLTVEGLTFRVDVNIKTVTQGEHSSNTGMTWEDTSVQVYLIGSTPVLVASLADVGRVVKLDDIVKPEPEPKGEAAPKDQPGALGA